MDEKYRSNDPVAFGSASWRARESLTARLKRQWSAVLDGPSVWGGVDVGPHRQGFGRYRLVVYPPGISECERRAVRMLRAWPTWGALLFLLLLVCLSGPLGPWMSLTAAAAVYLGAGGAAFTRARRVRAQVRTLSVVLIDRHFDPASADRFAELKLVVELLTQADQLREQGELSTTDHEVVWGLAYDRLAPDRLHSL